MVTLQTCFDVIRQTDKLHRFIPFDLEFVTANVRKQTGGEVKQMTDMVYLPPKRKGHAKNPNLYMNSTINIMPAGGGPITTVHLILIRKINNQLVH